MTYLDTVALIRSIASTVNPNGSFMHGRRVDGSGSYDEHFPQILLEPFVVRINPSTDFDTAEMVLGFMYQDNAANSLAQREAIIGLADELCRDFITELYSRAVSVENVRARPFYMIFSGVVSGYVLEFNLISKTASC